MEGQQRLSVRCATGPGSLSLDRLFGIRVPRWLTALVIVGSSATLVAGLLMEPEPPAEVDIVSGATALGEPA